MKASYVLPIAAIALLGAGALYAPLNPLDPKIVSVCTERDPIYAKKATEYVNALGISVTAEHVIETYNEAAKDFKSIYDAGVDASDVDGGIGAPYPQPETDENGDISLTSRIDAVEAALIGTGTGAAGAADNSLYRNTVDAIKAIQTDGTVGNLKTATSNVSTALGTETPIKEGDTLSDKVEKLQKLIAQAPTTDPQYQVYGSDPQKPMGIVDDGIGASTTTSLHERIIRVGKAIGFYKTSDNEGGDGDGEERRIPLSPDETYPGSYTPLTIRLDDLQVLIGRKKVYTQEMADAVSGGDPDPIDNNVGWPIDGEGNRLEAGQGLDDAAENYPFSKWNDPQGTSREAENRSIFTQLRDMITALDHQLSKVDGFTGQRDGQGPTLQIKYTEDGTTLQEVLNGFEIIEQTNR
jgi:hypothetical protein